MEEGEPVRIAIILQRRLMHQTADGEVGHHQAVELLPYQIGSFAAQHDLSPAQMSLEFIESIFYFPALMIKGCQFRGLRFRVKDSRCEPIDGGLASAMPSSR